MNLEAQDLYILDNTNSIRVWSISVIDWDIYIQYGQLDGSMQIKVEEVLEGKGGRSLEQQIISRVNSRINKQLDRGYSRDIEDARHKPVNQLGYDKPMLAKKFKDVKKIDFSNAYVQRKYDGNRCLITYDAGEIICYTRNGKVIPADLTHITQNLDLQDGETIDGELYCHGEKLQTIASWVKKDQPESKRLKYHVYDLISEESYPYRMDRLIEAVRPNMESIEIVQTIPVSDMEAVMKYHRQFIAEGYEGTILRHDNDGYEVGKRSKTLLKIKEFHDDEFQVIDIQPSKDGWAILECHAFNGKTFKVSAPGSMTMKRYILENRDDYVWRHVRVEYSQLTKDGVPFHPIATRFREIGED